MVQPSEGGITNAPRHNQRTASTVSLWCGEAVLDFAHDEKRRNRILCNLHVHLGVGRALRGEGFRIGGNDRDVGGNRVPGGRRKRRASARVGGGFEAMDWRVAFIDRPLVGLRRIGQLDVGDPSSEPAAWRSQAIWPEKTEFRKPALE